MDLAVESRPLLRTQHCASFGLKLHQFIEQTRVFLIGLSYSTDICFEYNKATEWCMAIDDIFHVHVTKSGREKGIVYFEKSGDDC